MKVSHAAFATTTVLALGTTAAAFTAATAVTTVATAALAILAVALAALTGASITAYMHPDSLTTERYFSTFQSHSGFAIVGSLTAIGKGMTAAVFAGLTEGAKTLVTRKIAGADQTIQITTNRN